MRGMEDSVLIVADKNTTSARTTEDKTLLMGSWDEFPLDTAENIQNWAENASRRAPYISTLDPIDMAVRKVCDQGSSSQAAIPGHSPARSTPITKGLPRSTNTTLQPDGISSSVRNRSRDLSSSEEQVPTSGFRADTLEGTFTAQTDRIICSNAGIPTRSSPRISNISEQFRQQFLW